MRRVREEIREAAGRPDGVWGCEWNGDCYNFGIDGLWNGCGISSAREA